MSMLVDIMRETVIVAGQMAPYLLFGFLAAGVLHAVVSPAWMRRHLGGRGLTPVVKSVLLGVPLPLCSCGVIAVAASMRKQGAGRGAVTGFLLATPQTGVDSIAATWGMLGPALGVFRPLMALVAGIVGGGAAALFDDEERGSASVAGHCGDGCSDPEERPERSIAEVFRYGLATLPRDIATPLVIGIILAGAIAALAPRDALAPYIGGGLTSMLVMTAVGTPLYVCATASIPVALSFMHLGASPGAALAFLIAGPATNAATLTTVWKVLGRRTALIYLGTVILGAIAAGMLFDALASQSWVNAMHVAHGAHQHESGLSLWNGVSALLLAAVTVNSVYGARVRGLLGWRQKTAAPEASALRIELTVAGMTCGHCANAAVTALKQTEGVVDAVIQLDRGRALVTGENIRPESLIEALTALGYAAKIADA